MAGSSSWVGLPQFFFHSSGTLLTGYQAPADHTQSRLQLVHHQKLYAYRETTRAGLQVKDYVEGIKSMTSAE